MSVRKFPAPKHPRPADWSGAWCRWCGEKIVKGQKTRTAHDGRHVLAGLYEPNCRLAYRLHTEREAQFKHVAERDGLKCWPCGATPEKWHNGGTVAFIGGEGEHRDHANPLMFWVGGTRYCPVERRTALELEHSRPLWEIAHLDDAERRPFFGPANLRLMCADCHRPKTAQEAGMRAKGDRMREKQSLDMEKPPAKLRGGSSLPGKGAGPKLRSRGFDPGHRPLRSRNDLKRRG